MSAGKVTFLREAPAKEALVANVCGGCMGIRVPARGCHAASVPRRCLVSAAFLAAVVSVLPVAAQAGQGHASFQVTLTIVARPPAPRVIDHSVFAAAPDFPVYPMLKNDVVKWENSGRVTVVRETRF